MKKLLSILGAVGLVATASTSVVSCGTKISNNPNYSYKDFEGWVNESIKNSENEIIFVGGRTDVDTLSFLAARQQASTGHANISDIKKLTDNKLSKEADEGFNNWVNTNDNAKSIQSSNFNSNSALTPDQTVEQNSTWLSNYFWKDKKSSINSLKLHSVLVDNLADFFKNGLGKDIIDKFITNQVKAINAQYYSDENNHKPYDTKNKKDFDNMVKNQIKATTKAISDKLTSNQGPFFLVISNGKLAGITTGYKNYVQFDPADLKKGHETQNVDLSNALNDLNDLFNVFSNNVWHSLYSWLSTNWFPKVTSADSLIVDNSTAITSWTGIANTHKTYNPDATKSSNDSSSNSNDSNNSSADNSNKDSGSSSDNSKASAKSFAVNLNNYID